MLTTYITPTPKAALRVCHELLMLAQKHAGVSATHASYHKLTPNLM